MVDDIQYKIEFTIDNLMMTIRMQGRMNTIINCISKMRSMQDNEFGNKRVGSDIRCCSPCTVVNESTSVLSRDVM